MGKIFLLFALVSIVFLSGCITGRTVDEKAKLAEEGDIVVIDYQASINKIIFDSTYDSPSTLTFTIGEHQVIRGLEEAVVGLKEGQTRTVIIPPDAAYPYDDKQVSSLNLNVFQNFTGEFKAGMIVFYNNKTGLIRDIVDNSIIIDWNKPLIYDFAENASAELAYGKYSVGQEKIPINSLVGANPANFTIGMKVDTEKEGIYGSVTNISNDTLEIEWFNEFMLQLTNTTRSVMISGEYITIMITVEQIIKK